MPESAGDRFTEPEKPMSSSHGGSQFQMPKMPPLPEMSGNFGAILRILPVVILLWAGWTCFYTVPVDSNAVVMRFGKVIDVRPHGLHFKVPFGIDRVEIVAVDRQQTMEFGSTRDANVPGHQRSAYERFQQSQNPDEERTMLTGDLNMASVEWVVQYLISDPKAYLFNMRAPERTLRDASEATMREAVGDRTVDEVITFGRQEIENHVLTQLQETVSAYGMGIEITQVQLSSVNPPGRVDPPGPVVRAFSAVNEAQQEKETLINEADREYNREVPKARGLADQSVQEAEGYALQRVNEASGDANRFLSVFEEYQKAPEVTRQRLYLETLNRVLPKMGRKTILDAELSGVLPFLPLEHALPTSSQP